MHCPVGHPPDDAVGVEHLVGADHDALLVYGKFFLGSCFKMRREVRSTFKLKGMLMWG